MFVIILCTCPDSSSASALAEKLVTNSLAACVNIIPEINSVYTWEGKLETSQESLLIIKTRQDSYQQVEEFITCNHPYDCPEIIALPIKQGSTAYLNWLTSSLRS